MAQTQCLNLVAEAQKAADTIITQMQAIAITIPEYNILRIVVSEQLMLRISIFLNGCVLTFSDMIFREVCINYIKELVIDRTYDGYVRDIKTISIGGEVMTEQEYIRIRDFVKKHYGIDLSNKQKRSAHNHIPANYVQAHNMPMSDPNI